MKIGISIASVSNPSFLRSVMLQLAQQTLTPNYVSVHENGSKNAVFEWACRDIDTKYKVIYKHTPEKTAIGRVFMEPLKELLSTDCTHFAKCDSDDFFYSRWLESLSDYIDNMDWVVNRRNSVFLSRKDGNHYWPSVDFGSINMLGGMADNVMYTRRVAERYLKEMQMHPDIEDDVSLYNVLPEFKNGKIITGDVFSCYISHGANASTAYWQSEIPNFKE